MVANKLPMLLAGLTALVPAGVLAGDEMLQCADKKGDPAIYRKGECQPLDDPTRPAGYVPQPGSGGTSASGGDAAARAEVEELRRRLEESNDRHFLEVEELRKKLEEVKEKKGEADTLRDEVEDLKRRLTEATEQHFEEVETIRKELVEAREKEQAKQQERIEAAKAKEALSVNTTRFEEMPPLGAPGPWRVTQIVVPAQGGAGKSTPMTATINGVRYHVGERVDGGGVVKGIQRDRVVMLHDGREYEVQFHKKSHALMAGRVGVVPLKRSFGDAYIVKIRINNNMEIDAILDTGASVVSLPEDVVLWLRRSGTLKPNDYLGKGKVSIADGSVKDSKEYLIRYLRVGDMEVRNVIALEIVGEKGDGKNKDEKKDKDKKDDNPKKEEEKPDVLEVQHVLLGINVLKELGRWRIDHANDLLIVER
ncbi:MAG: retroviral-like aspartic protease family protein [Magnetococcales bacterium]|nr:retroviral-like aspartic protease family protein [Magnetococcales bacterium]